MIIQLGQGDSDCRGRRNGQREEQDKRRLQRRINRIISRKGGR
jgi:hypothetical protein